MCGIYGFAFGNLNFETNTIERMKASIQHRGPDELYEYSNGTFWLGTNRLSIVDVANGRQPMVKDIHGHRYVIVYNGELYNADEIRQIVSQAGLRPTTKCDTELVLLAYVALGKSCVEKFNGQYGFAILDESKEEVFLSRDIAGIKPLFYTEVNGSFVFASEIKALFCFPGVTKFPNQEALCEYFLHGYAFASGYVTGERTFFSNIYALPPAHCMTVSRTGTRIEKYWDISLTDDNRSVADFADECRAIFDESISAYVSDEVPVGTALSGGLDSSIITYLAGRAMNGLGKKLITRSIKYEGQEVNEDYDHALILLNDLNKKGLNIDAAASVLTPDNYLNDLDRMIYHFDEPHWEIKQLAMFNNYKALKEGGAKVVLTGEGADELFLGYYQKFPGFKNPKLSSVEEFRTLWSRRIDPVKQLFTREFADAHSDTMQSLINNSLEKYYAPYASTCADSNKTMQCWYYHTFLHWLLTVNDRCSAAFSLEGRFPFLNKKMIELAFRVPSALNIDDEMEKKILRKAFEDVLPQQIVQRKKAPLPSAIDLNFHRKLQQAFEENILTASSDFWNIFSRKHLEQMNGEFKRRIQELEFAGKRATGGRDLTEYIYLNQDIELRTTHIFSLLTTFRWWDINFVGGFHE